MNFQQDAHSVNLKDEVKNYERRFLEILTNVRTL